MLDIDLPFNADLSQLATLSSTVSEASIVDSDSLNARVASASASSPAVDLSTFASGRLPDAVLDRDLTQRATSDDFLLKGGKADDILYGTSGHHILTGRAGNDYLEALSGEDWLIGGSGSDILVDSIGGSALTGGTGTQIDLKLVPANC